METNTVNPIPQQKPPDFIPDEQASSGPQPSSLPSPDENQNWKGSYGIVPPDFIPDEQASSGSPPSFISDRDAPKFSKASSPLQQAGTIAENVAEGALGPIATGAELGLSNLGVPGLSSQDILNRQKTNPGDALLGRTIGMTAISTLTPEIGAAMKIGRWGQAGLAALNGAIKMGIISGGNEVSKYLLGTGNAPLDAAKQVGIDSALGALGGGAFGALGATGGAITSYAGVKGSSSVMSSTLAGIGHAMENPGTITPLEEALSTNVNKEILDPGFFKIGQAIGNSAIPVAVGGIAKHFLPAEMSPSLAYGLGGLGAALSGPLEKVIGKNIPSYAKEAAASVFLKAAASNQTEGLDQCINSAVNLAKGHQIIGKTVKALFDQAPQDYLHFVTDERQRDKLKETVDSDNNPEPIQAPIPKQGFAEGGQVQPVNTSNPMHDLYPEFGMAVSTAKGRIKGYLNSLKPNENKTKLPYDLNQKNPQEEHEYNKVVDLAVKPLSILKKVKEGSLTPKQMIHFTSLYPELHQELSQKIHSHIAESRLNNDPKPEYKTRQALSLFLGTDLDSSLTPQSIMAAQNVFMSQKSQQGVPSKTNILSKASQSAQTPEQSREARLNKN